MTQPWNPVNPSLTSGTHGGRHPDIYLAVVQQFEVEHALRYRSIDSVTWCNVFVWDVTRSMCAEVPHWWAGRELTANAMLDWLVDLGPKYGWEACDAKGAVEHANQGMPAVVAWKNPAGPGHIAVVVPGPTEMPPRIAQAGKNNFVGKDVRSGFGALPVSYFRHA